MNNPIVGIAVVVVGASGAKMANTVALNGYEMAGILQPLSVTSCLAAQKADATAAQAQHMARLWNDRCRASRSQPVLDVLNLRGRMPET